MAKKKKSKNPHAVALGRLGGRKGGKVRFSKLTPEQRSELGRKAVLARWAKQRKSKSAANVIQPDKPDKERA
jgi:hypothetical protein